MSITTADITAVILAGGQGSRLGGADKGLLTWQGQTLVAYLIAALRPQVHTLLINANRNQATYQHYGYPVVSDTLADYQGPLAGLLSAMQVVETPYLLTIPCDSLYLAEDFVARLIDILNNNAGQVVVAHDGQRLQPTYALVPVDLLPKLHSFINQGGRKVRVWLEQQPLLIADCTDLAWMFQNINTPEHYQALQKGIV